MTGVCRALLYDGRTAIRHEVTVSADGDAIAIHGHGRVPAHKLIAISGSTMAYGRGDLGGWRLILTERSSPDLAALLPKGGRYGSWIDRFGLARAALVLGAISTAAITVVLAAPAVVGPLVPWSAEKRIGDALVGDLGEHFCDARGGQAALGAMVSRIGSGPYPIRVHVVNVPMLNAVALPGGTILVFQGLLEQAKSPDELAGVLGHEIGHVRERHVMQGLLRQMGLSLLLGGYGGNIGGTMSALLSARYGQKAEASADDDAIDAMRRAHIDPRDTAALFTRLSKVESVLGPAAKALSYVASHPVSSDRAARFNASRSAASYTPALPAPQWQALTRICLDDPKRRDDKPFDIFS